MQFHGFRKQMNARCLWQEIEHPVVSKDNSSWISLFAHIVEAVRYLHDEAKVLHNDATPSNILMSPCTCESSGNPEYQLVLVDFGKATLIAEPKVYRLTECEKVEYTRKYPHIAPEGNTTNPKKRYVLYGWNPTRQRFLPSKKCARASLKSVGQSTIDCC